MGEFQLAQCYSRWNWNSAIPIVVFVDNAFGMGEFQLAQYYFGGIGIPPSQYYFRWNRNSTILFVILGGIGIPPSQCYFRWNRNSAIPIVVFVDNAFGMGEFQLAQYYFGGIGIPSSYLLFWVESEFHPPICYFGRNRNSTLPILFSVESEFHPPKKYLGNTQASCPAHTGLFLLITPNS